MPYDALSDSLVEAPAPPALPPSAVVELAMGWYSTMARLEDGTVWYWGHWLDGPEQTQATPVQVPVSEPPRALASAGGHAFFCAIGETGARCLGRMPLMYGKGWGDFWERDHGAPPPGELRQVALGSYHGCALLADTTVRCWGMNGSGQLGDGSTTDSKQARRVGKLDKVIHIGAGSAHGCAVRADGSVWCWGDNDHAQLGDPDWTKPDKRIVTRGNELSIEGGLGPGKLRRVAGIEHAVELAVGTFHNCVRFADGTVGCWGSNTERELGTPGHDARPTVVAVPGVADIVQLVSRGDAACARRNDGHVLCWGHDQQSDSSGLKFATAPHEIPGLDDARHIAANTYGGCAVRASGAVACWGSRRFGQLGDGETTGSAALSHVRW